MASAQQQHVPTSMQAWIYTTATGGLENSLRMVTQDIPDALLHPKGGRVLVEVLAMSLNPADYKIAESPFLSRMLIKKPASPGLDVYGRLVGDDQKLVIGRLDFPDQHGTLGQYVTLGQNDFVQLPKGIDVNEAAAMSSVALTAYQAIVPYAKRGDRVFINGGSGGVGSFCIQIAKLIGCYVVASSSGSKEGLCKELGADEVVEYTKVDVAETLGHMQAFNLVVDNAGVDKAFHRQSEAFLTPNGLFVLVSATDQGLDGVLSMISSWLRPAWLGGPKRRWKFILTKNDRETLQQISEWVAAGKLRVLIDEVFDFGDAPKAIKKIKSGRTRGKVVVRAVSASTWPAQ